MSGNATNQDLGSFRGRFEPAHASTETDILEPILADLFVLTCDTALPMFLHALIAPRRLQMIPEGLGLALAAES